MNTVGLVLAMGCAAAGAATPTDPLTAARRELAAGYFWDATVLAELALRTTPSSPALSLLAALCEASSDPRAGDLRALTGATKMPPPPPMARFKAGNRAFVAATFVPLRREPAATAAVLAALPGNASVEVIDVRGDWVKTRWRRLVPGKRHVFIFVGRKPAAPGKDAQEELQGWLHAADLSASALDAAALAARAEAALAAGQPGAALNALRLALAARPDDEKIRRAFIRQALDASFESLAAQTAWQRRRGSLSGDTMGVDAMEVYYGCRGNLVRAAVVRELTDAHGLKRMPEDACVQRVDPQPPCRSSASKRFQKWRRNLDATFSKPHWLRVSVTNRRPSDVAELWVLRDDEPPPTCGDPVDYGPPEETWRVEIPPIASGAAVDLWFEIPTYLGQRLRLSTSPEREDAVAETTTPGAIDCEARIECD